MLLRTKSQGDESFFGEEYKDYLLESEINDYATTHGVDALIDRLSEIGAQYGISISKEEQADERN